MSHPDQELLWLAQGKKPLNEQRYLDPYALYNFFASANSERTYNRRAKSAIPRTSNYNDKNPMRTRNHGHHPSWKTPNLSVGTLKNPSPTPVISRPSSSRSGDSSARSVNKVLLSSPTAMYLGPQRGRCKSAPPRPMKYVPWRPQTGKSRVGSAVSSARGAPQRAWQIRTNSASTHRSLLSPEEIQKRQRKRCKSAPLPYDFSAVELVIEVPDNGTDYDRLKTMTKPLACMPDIVQTAVTHNGIRHCCSAYNITKPKTAPDTRHQFWPVARPSVYRRGFVPRYFHFVKPAIISGQSPTNQSSGYGTQSETDEDLADASLLVHEEDKDLDEMILFEESFVVPDSPTEPSISEQWDSLDVDANTMDNILNEYLRNDDDDQERLPSEPVINEKDSDSLSDYREPELEVIITTVKSPSPEPTKLNEPLEQELIEEESIKIKEKVTEEVVEPEQPPKEEEMLDAQEVTESQEEPIPSAEEIEPERVPEEEPVSVAAEEPSKQSTTSPLVSNPEPKVKFVDSITVTSYKPPKPEMKEPIKPILKPSKPPAAVHVQPPVTEKKPKPKPQYERRQGDIRPQTKPEIIKPEPQLEDEEEKVEEKEELETPKLVPEKLPDPEFVRAPGAYRMYEPLDLLQYGLEQARDNRASKKSATMPLPQGIPSGRHQLLPESSVVMNSVMDEEKRKREGVKPWLQGRLALSKQTSRFELPMDVKVLESMSAMEYLTKYCIISTRRKALYKHVFLKVDKDRDGIISFRELDKGLKEIHVDSIDTKQVKQIAEMVEANDKTKFNLKQFSAIAAFSERILFSDFVTEETKGINSTKEIIEEADFCSLKWKLDGFNVSPTVRKILESL